MAIIEISFLLNKLWEQTDIRVSRFISFDILLDKKFVCFMCKVQKVVYNNRYI